METKPPPYPNRTVITSRPELVPRVVTSVFEHFGIELKVCFLPVEPVAPDKIIEIVVVATRPEHEVRWFDEQTFRPTPVTDYHTLIIGKVPESYPEFILFSHFCAIFHPMLSNPAPSAVISGVNVIPSWGNTGNKSSIRVLILTVPLLVMSFDNCLIAIVTLL